MKSYFKNNLGPPNTRWRVPHSTGRSILVALFVVGLMTIGRVALADENLCETVLEIPKAECEILVALYNKTDGENWSNRSAWLLTNTPCHWHGVTCGNVQSDGKKHVTGLELRSNRLKGHIPPALSNLAHLQTLNLYSNKLSGEIPLALGNLAHLQTLNLYSNQLSGEIPSALGNLAHLQTLNLGYNKLSGNIPLALGNLTHLRYLGLYNNQLSGNIPLALGSLANLQTLYLYNNKLTGNVPPALGNLVNLYYLYLENNPQLTGALPSTLVNLSKLRNFSFRNTQLCEPMDIPFQTWLGNLGSLRSTGRRCSTGAVVNCNEVTDMPTLECQALVALYNSTGGDNWTTKSGWALTKTPCDWSGVTCGNVESDGKRHVTTLNLYHNQLSGEIPAALGNLAHLQTLQLGYNKLTGNIPAALGNLAKLQTLYLYNNQLSGNIPPALGNLAHLRNLYLYNNKLSGNVPPALGNLSNLGYLHLDNNRQLTGPLPETLTNLSKLRYFYFRNTQLCEPIDVPFQTWLGNLGGLGSTGVRCSKGAVVNCNEVTDIPTLECQVLVTFYNSTDGANWINRSGWALTKTPCDWYGVTCGNVESDGKKHVTGLSLTSNRLKNHLPPALSNLAHLQTINLYYNQLSGEIPPALGNLAHLQTLQLGYNKLSGNIPAALGNLTHLRYLNLYNNQLSGEIPPALGNLANLQTLYLYNNKLSGNIPSALGNLANLYYLHLENNRQLTGPLPETLTNLSKLRYFYFRNTDLCESTEPSFQNWLVDIGHSLGSTGARCIPLDYAFKACSSPTVQTVNTGNWEAFATWADMSGNSVIPGQDDIVLINEGHTVTGISSIINVKALCNKGTLWSQKNHWLNIHATEGIFNYGNMLGQNGQNGSGLQCGQSGSNIILFNGKPSSNTGSVRGVPFYNQGKIQAGNGGNSERCHGASGGYVHILGRDVTNEATGKIIGGTGGETTSGKGGLGGFIFFWGKLGSEGDLINKGTVRAGDGGKSHSDKGGFGGSILLTASNVYLSGSHQAGKGGNGSSNGNDGFVKIEPHFIALTKGANITGGDITIFGGDEWTLDFSRLESTAIESTGNITLAVGNNSLINLTGVKGTVLKAAGDVKIFADRIILDKGVELSDVIQAANIVTAPSKILYDVLLTTGMETITGQPNTTLPLSFTLSNNGPTADTYTLTVSDSAGWTLSQLPSSIKLEGLTTTDFTLNVTLPSNVDDGNIIEVTATSQMDANVKSVAKVNFPAKPDYIASGSLRDNEGAPLVGITVQIGDKTSVTDETGAWEIIGLPEGEYTLSVNKHSYNLATKNMSLEDDKFVIALDIQIDVAVPTSALCQLYAVHDEKRNDSQFFTVNLNDLTISELGPMYNGHDIESLAIHPETNMIYAASGDNVTNGKKGHFYIVDGQTGQLFPVGSTGFTEIEALTFSPDGTLYAWAKGDGLTTIDLITGNGTLVLPAADILVEALTLDKNQGRLFFGVDGTDLWQYDMTANTLEVICPNGLRGETEALEIMPDGLLTPNGLLLVGSHEVPFGLHAFDTQSCQIIEADETLSNQYNDVEGLAVPVAACTD
jgi:Leucine-rich repeat (LRR) protein